MQELGIEQNLEIKVIDKETETRAENLIKRGLEEHFGTYDDSYNPDLKGIIKNYIEQGHIFLVGVYQDQVICTGALMEMDQETGQIARMSVAKEYRRNGLGSRMLTELEQRAKEKGYKKIVLGTNADWVNARGLYESYGYQLYNQDTESVHYKKILK